MSAAPPSRMQLALEGGLFVGATLPIAWGLVVLVTLALQSGVVERQVVGVLGAVVAVALMPVGAVIGAAVSVVGAPEGRWLRRIAAAALTFAVLLACWILALVS